MVYSDEKERQAELHVGRPARPETPLVVRVIRWIILLAAILVLSTTCLDKSSDPFRVYRGLEALSTRLRGESSLNQLHVTPASECASNKVAAKDRFWTERVGDIPPVDLLDHANLGRMSVHRCQSPGKEWTSNGRNAMVTSNAPGLWSRLTISRGNTTDHTLELL